MNLLRLAKLIFITWLVHPDIKVSSVKLTREGSPLPL